MPKCSERDGRGSARRARLAGRKGMHFHTGPNPETDLTDGQILEQCKMYIAAMRIADDFGCDAIGIQYQQGLKDLAPASDLAEGLLNNVDRPPVTARGNGRVLYEGRAAAALQRGGRVRRPRRAGDEPRLDGAWVSTRRPRSTIVRYGEDVTYGENSSGCSRSRALCRRSTSSAAMRARSANGSRPCISASAAGP